MTLEEVLESREWRALRQSAALEAFRRPVLSATLVIPGPVKDFLEARLLMQEARRALGALLRERGWPLLGQWSHAQATGPELLLVVDAEAHALKAAAAGLESEHPLGRLWDFDVLDPLQGPIPRRALGLPPRPCLLCGEDGHACARSRAHSVEELVGALKEKVVAHLG